MKEITYRSTRGGETGISASAAILQGLAGTEAYLFRSICQPSKREWTN